VKFQALRNAGSSQDAEPATVLSLAQAARKEQGEASGQDRDPLDGGITDD
jgi:hypothetical protein